MILSRNLSFTYPGGPLIEFPDVDLAQGGQLLLQGPSGCGKSTWLALVAGLRRPLKGELTVAGQALSKLGSRALDAWRGRSIGFLPQRLHLSQALDVASNLSLVYFACGRALDSERIGAILARLGLSEFLRRRPRELSVGQAQRVALARALLLSPRLILADEPTASLDDAAASDALALLQACAAESGASLVIATHDGRVRSAMPQAAQVRWTSSRAAAQSVLQPRP